MKDFKDTYLRTLYVNLHELDNTKQYTLVTRKNLTVDKTGEPRSFKLYRSFGGYKWYPYISVKNMIPDGSSFYLVEMHFSFKDLYDIHAESTVDYNENWWLIPNIDYELS